MLEWGISHLGQEEAPMKYVVMSTTVQDNIHFPNNDAEICAAGGAGSGITRMRIA